MLPMRTGWQGTMQNHAEYADTRGLSHLEPPESKVTLVHTGTIFPDWIFFFSRIQSQRETLGPSTWLPEFTVLKHRESAAAQDEESTLTLPLLTQEVPGSPKPRGVPKHNTQPQNYYDWWGSEVAKGWDGPGCVCTIEGQFLLSEIRIQLGWKEEAKELEGHN